MSRKRPRHKQATGSKGRPQPQHTTSTNGRPVKAGGPGASADNATLSKSTWLGLIAALVVVLAVAGGIALKRSKSGKSVVPAPDLAESSLTVRHPSFPAKGPVTFNREIAPILFDNCARCHHAGEAAPFSLLSYDDAKKHAKQIVQATQRRFMPPWLPEKGYGEFVGERRLDEIQIRLIKRWVEDGAVEGAASDLPSAPHFAEGWQLGEPDLILTMPQAYNLAAEGKDVYRNLVTPIPVPHSRFVKGVEFRAGNPRVLHHAFIDVDETRQSRRLAEKQNPPGFDGMEVPETAIMPEGQLLGWQPGKAPSFCAPGLSWQLRTNTDLVLQLHMHPSGKPEVVQPTLGFYFTDLPPTNAPFRIGMKCFTLDIPAGTNDYSIEESYTLPIDTTILRVAPHAHYLAKDMQSWAVLPNGEKRWMIWIKDWDFNWQGDYEYKRPQFFPAGTRMVMHYTYDNSTNNIRNPSQPPKRVRFGLQTTDEMGEIWFQGIARTSQERQKLAENYYYYLVNRTMGYDYSRLRIDPSDADAHTRLGHDLLVLGKIDDARNHLLAAVASKPDFAKAHYELALLYVSLRNWKGAYQQLSTAIRLEPDNSQAYGNLGYVYLNTGKRTEARAAFETALHYDPDDSIVRDFLNRLLRGEL